MTKIFRLHGDASQNIHHWEKLPGHYHDGLINTIVDPANATAKTQITSIPSPFARLDLVKTAFRYLTSKQQLDGNTIYHKIISDCLDIAELFFNYEALAAKIEVLEWRSGQVKSGGEIQIDHDSDLGRLLSSANPKHRLAAETLWMFFSQDSKAFNFADLRSLFLLNYRLGPEEMNVIGGTSPSTLFFSSANNLSYVDIRFGNHQVFSDQYLPLHLRDEAFVLFIFNLRKAYPEFAEKFPDVNDYLEMSFSQLDNIVREKVIASSSESYEERYLPLAVGAENNYAEINGFPLKIKDAKSIAQDRDEDFKIAANKTVTGIVPLVLPLEAFSEEMTYAGGMWQRNYHQSVKPFDERPISERTLPNFDHIKMPYLTICDLFQPYIMRLPFPVDTNSFFMGGYQGKNGGVEQGFALPLKRKIFEYFTLEDIMGYLPDGKRMFELSPLSNGLKAIMRVPVGRGKYVTLSRLYHANQVLPDERSNIGAIADHQFSIGIYPFVSASKSANAHYRIMLAERDHDSSYRNSDCLLKFYHESDPETVLKTVKRERSSKKTTGQVASRFYIAESGFDLIEVTQQASANLIIPVFPAQLSPSRNFKFAIDFGTTNTHIEYQVNGEEPKVFELVGEGHLKTLHDKDHTETFFNTNVTKVGLADQLTQIFREEFVPEELSVANDFHFPQRTVIYDSGTFNPDEANYALADFNIPFWYLKERLDLRHGNNKITSNLKWADFKSDSKLEKRTRGFLKQIMLMLRNKVIAQNGDLDATEVVLFYPNSMPRFRRQFLQEAWATYYKRYFPGGSKLYHLSESFAPFQYFRHKFGVQAMHRPVVSVDIGGGTTDVVIYKENQPLLLTSFQFASNSLFGDGYGHTSADNGFVKAFEGRILQILENSSAAKLKEVYENVKAKNSNSIELMEFFFSLQDNKTIRDANISFSFSKMLADDLDLRIVLLIYYSAIMYHIAKLMKARGLDFPRYLTFSGNGSKVIKLLSSDTGNSALIKFTSVIFEDVYQKPFTESIEIKLLEQPKEATCKGGLLLTDYAGYHDIEEKVRDVLVGNAEDQLVSASPLNYSQLGDEALLSSVHTEVCAFIDKFFKWNDTFNYYNNFGIGPRLFQEYSDVLKDDLRLFLNVGVAQRQEQSNDNLSMSLEETLFFYPLTGAINKLAYHITKNNKA